LRRALSERAAGIALLQVCVAAEHHPVRVSNGPRQFEHDRVEENEARRFKQTAANCRVASIGA
jgi:hypothetical protein